MIQPQASPENTPVVESGVVRKDTNVFSLGKAMAAHGAEGTQALPDDFIISKETMAKIGDLTGNTADFHNKVEGGMQNVAGADNNNADTQKKAA